MEKDIVKKLDEIIDELIDIKNKLKKEKENARRNN